MVAKQLNSKLSEIKNMCLPQEFYLREDVLLITKELLGKTIYTYTNGILTGGIISEVEAYAGATDKASHAYNNRRTNRTEAMFQKGGISYVYLCYGMHYMFNVVTNIQDIPHAILLRAFIPMEGIDEMLIRRNKTRVDKTLANGPGTCTQALGININHNMLSLAGPEIFICDEGYEPDDSEITTSPRIGVDYAEEDALLEYNFKWKMNKKLDK